ncbi:MAG: hypothetical protein PUB67_07720 [Clostridiales bacterium]|nr:hypothetical protein [Clostridiales bacterium]
MYKNEFASEIYEALKTDNRVLIYGIAGVGKTAFSLQLSVDKYVANTYIDCENDYDYLAGLAKNSENEEMLAKYIYDTFGVSYKFQNNLIFIFDNIDSTDFYYNELFNELAKTKYKQILIATAVTPSVEMIKKEIKSFMFTPISFEDFLYFEENDLSFELLAHFRKGIDTIPLYLHDGIYRSFVDFYYTGGMPVPRNTYFRCEYGDVLVSSAIKTSYHHVISTLYKRSNISEKLRYQCEQILSSVIAQMAEPDYSRYIIAGIREGASFKEYQAAFEFLEKNGIIYRVYNLDNPNSFCCFLYDFSTMRELIHEYNFKRGFSMNKDDMERIVIRNYLVQYFIKNGYDIYFWRSRYKAYVDIVIKLKNKMIAINVSGEESIKDKSLAEFAKKYNNSELIEVYGENLKKENNKWKIPYYAISSIVKMDL